MIYVISKATFGSYNVRDIQCNANWDCCPYSDYALIPDNLVDGILATQGYCDITLNSAGTEVTAFTARTIPSVPEECCGTNTVLSVNGVKANTDGELTLTAAQVGALPTTGGTMTGAIAMGGKKITGLGTPTANTDAATKAYADKMLPKSGGTMTGALTTTAVTISGTSPTITFNETDGKDSSHLVNGNRHYLRSIASDTTYYEQFRTPVPSTGLTGNKSYDFLTTKTVTDYVTAQGTSGDWYYRKWNSGRAECWQRNGANASASGTSGQNINFPFTFTSYPFVSAQGGDPNGTAGIVNVKSLYASTTAIHVNFIASASTYFDFYLYASGKWK